MPRRPTRRLVGVVVENAGRDRNGTPRGLPPRPVGERFWPKVRKSAGCWEWTGRTSEKGYGDFHLNRQTVLAHRVSYELLVGPIPEGLTLDHLCRNTRCVNPAHLEPVTHGENMRRMGLTTRQSHCRRGHELSEPNLYVFKTGGRACKTCAKDRAARRRRSGL